MALTVVLVILDVALALMAKDPLLVRTSPLDHVPLLALALGVLTSAMATLAALGPLAQGPTEALDPQATPLGLVITERDNAAGDEEDKKDEHRRRHGHGHHHHRRHHHHHHDYHHDEKSDQVREESQDAQTMGKLDDRFKSQLEQLETLYRDTIQAIDASYKTARKARKDAYKTARKAAKRAKGTADADANAAASETLADGHHELRQALKTSKKEWKESRAKVFNELQHQMVSVASQMVEELTTPDVTTGSSSSMAAADGVEKAPVAADSRDASTVDDDDAKKHEQDRLAFVLKLQTWIAAAQDRMDKAKHVRKQHAGVEEERINKRRPCHRRGGRWGLSPLWSYGQGHPDFSDHLYAYGGPHDPSFPFNADASATATQSTAEGPFATTSTAASSSSPSSSSMPFFFRPPYPLDYHHEHHGGLPPPPPYAAMQGPYHPRLMHKMARRHLKMMRHHGHPMDHLERKMGRARHAMMCGGSRRHHRGHDHGCCRKDNKDAAPTASATAAEGERSDCNCAGTKRTMVDKDKKGKRKAATTVSDMEIDGAEATEKHKGDNDGDESDASCSSSSSWSSSGEEDEDESDLELDFELGLEDDELSESNSGSSSDDGQGGEQGEGVCSKDQEGKDDNPMNKKQEL
ncbi:hypothetical protein DFQ27_002218 [Actinomortierella ambigua]|uniref:Uncharacterized protein n=1 Tax=Actinomortierella ambigua TaxID=1343610 RepID=A0A9P6QB08_9FUNG|nr:hypothetical protein DFQ27_002218 [Actinomortierella ambigua]